MDEPSSFDQVRKDVWYKVKLEDGRVGYVYTHNMKLTPPEDIAALSLHANGWVEDREQHGRSGSRGKEQFHRGVCSIGKDPGCDYTRLYFMSWSTKLKRRVISWQFRLSGVLPVTDYHSEGKPASACVTYIL